MNATIAGTLAAILMTASATAAETPRHGGTLRVEHRDNPPSASLLEEATISTVMPFASVFNNLVTFGTRTDQDRADDIVPDLAESWAWNPEGTALTFRLRHGVRFHNGRPFTAADVKCTFDLIQGKGETRLRKNPRRSWYFDLKDVTTTGDDQVTFNLDAPEPSLLTMLASGFAPIYPCGVSAADQRTHPIGTGPFKFVSWQQNESIKLVRNSDYFKPGLPYLDAIEYTIIPNRSTALLAFEAGKYDLTFVSDIPPILLKDIKAQDPNAICLSQPNNTQANLLVNFAHKPFDNPEVRRAMMLSLDRRAFVDILSQGVNKIGGAMLPPPAGIWGMPEDYLKNVVGYGPDVAANRAEGRKIMAGLGYGPDKMLNVKIETRDIASYRDPAVILIDHLKNVFIQGTLEPLDSAVWYARLARKDYAVAMNVQGIAVDDPDVVLFETYACKSERNYTGYCNPALEKLFHEQSETTDFARRRQMVWNIDQKLQEDGARPVIMHNVAVTCWQPDVHDVHLPVNSIYDHWRFEDVWLDK
ncbi:MAG: ABC transporter substrate-binding protein [Acetobacteraceae bacterium]